MSTPHNQANKGDIAKIVLMPGDPLRAKFVADSFLNDVVQFNSVRNMFGYTGTYKGVRVSVMASGMGIPSIGIYSYELYHDYDVDTIIRIGSAGAYYKETKLYEMVLASGAFSRSTYAYTQSGDNEVIQSPSFELNERIKKTAERLNIPYTESIVHSSDCFYNERVGEVFINDALAHGAICVEMEAFGLFHNAKVFGKKAACLLTITDNIVTHEQTTHEERRYSLINMIKLALEVAVEEDEQKV